MIRSSLAVVALVCCAGFVVACGGDPVGRICDLGTVAPAGEEVVVASPSLDCVSRTCLSVPGQTTPSQTGEKAIARTDGLCTSECESDSDCDRVPESPCSSGFNCSVQVTVGPFCCRKFCVCKDYVVIPTDGVIPTPLACDPTVQANGCCNLAGRAGNAAYPACP
jgi:hypothetical protein